ncbi:hypothetical protein ALC62_12701 [Cyphomyrmex costatus]|uniref:Uncharacterized protein n=1 Tax=Cyphomyrmex costatus TaxID=456900 RepID=A0A195C713_9HYME|nr:hypothetical protein ALC62_12701 [Cyphomyrmex costatus]
MLTTAELDVKVKEYTARFCGSAPGLAAAIATPRRCSMGVLHPPRLMSREFRGPGCLHRHRCCQHRSLADEGVRNVPAAARRGAARQAPDEKVRMVYIQLIKFLINMTFVTRRNYCRNWRADLGNRAPDGVTEGRGWWPSIALPREMRHSKGATCWLKRVIWVKDDECAQTSALFANVSLRQEWRRHIPWIKSTGGILVSLQSIVEKALPAVGGKKQEFMVIFCMLVPLKHVQPIINPIIGAAVAQDPPACPQLAKRRREEERSATDPRGLRIEALIHDVHDDDDDDGDGDGDVDGGESGGEKLAGGTLHDRRASRTQRTIEIAKPEMSNRRHIAH